MAGRTTRLPPPPGPAAPGGRAPPWPREVRLRLAADASSAAAAVVPGAALAGLRAARCASVGVVVALVALPLLPPLVICGPTTATLLPPLLLLLLLLLWFSALLCPFTVAVAVVVALPDGTEACFPPGLAPFSTG